MRATPEEWEELRASIRVDAEQMMRLCKVGPRTWRRWRKHGPPAAVLALARALAADLAPHGWPGWSIQGELLWPPGSRTAREAYRMHDVEFIAAARWIIAMYQRGDRAQRRESQALRGQSDAALECMRRLRDGLNQACEAYDGLRSTIGGAPRVWEEPERGWRRRR